MVDSELACPRGRDWPSWAAHTAAARSSATREVVGAAQRSAGRVIRGCGNSESTIYPNGAWGKSGTGRIGKGTEACPLYRARTAPFLLRP
jgi:hypothetical protein